MKPTVLTLDSLDVRRQVFTAVLRGLTPARRLDFLDWCCAFARITTASPLLREAKADRRKMLPLTKAATLGDDVANLRHANECYMDIGTLAHHFGVEWQPVIEELERWALGRETTPVAIAAHAWQSRARHSVLPIRTSGISDYAPLGRAG